MSDNLDDKEKNDREKIRSNGSPLFVVLAPLRIAGSIWIGMTLMAVLLVVLAWGTFIESEYGSAVSQFVLYHNYWFICLLALLCINVLCAVVLRFPWRRYHIPFLLAHCGLLVLFFGCYLTWQGGEEAQITLPEGTMGRLATRTKDQQLFFKYIDHQTTRQPEKKESFSVSFSPGPFNWSDYQRENWIKGERKYTNSLWFALQLAHRDRGSLAEHVKDVQIEVLDYLAASALETVPPLGLNILWKKSIIQKTNDEGEAVNVARNWEPVSLQMHQQVSGLLDTRGASETMTQGERVSFSVATVQDEVKAFQTSQAQGGEKSGFWGEVVLYYGGRNYHLNADTLISLGGDKRLAVEGSNLEIGEVRFRERGPILNFSVFTSSGVKESLMLFPDNPEMNVHARKLGVFGAYWVEPAKILKKPEYADSPTVHRLALPRYDLLQGPDKMLYYRLWSGEKIVDAGVFPDTVRKSKTPVTIAAGTSLEADVVVERFVPCDVPGSRIVSLPVNQINRGHSEQRLKLRISFDGNEEVFWLRAVVPTVVPLMPEPDQVRYLYGKNRTLQIQWDFKTIDLGFGIFLKEFEQRTEPGTKMSTYFSSLVDFVELRDPASTETFSRKYHDFVPLPNGENILISMNRPAYYKGKGDGYRIYQSSYMGPYHPSQPQFFELYDGEIFPWETKPRESISMSTFSVNSDPGRGWKYVGGFLIVIGTAMFVCRRRGK